MNSDGLMVIVTAGYIVGLTLGAIVYFRPTLIAFRRNHKNAGLVALVDVFFGWSGIGWLIALAWACFGEANPVDEHGNLIVLPPGSDGSKICPQCAEVVKAAALKCRFCGTDFPKNEWLPHDEERLVALKQELERRQAAKS